MALNLLVLCYTTALRTYIIHDMSDEIEIIVLREPSSNKDTHVETYAFMKREKYIPHGVQRVECIIFMRFINGTKA